MRTVRFEDPDELLSYVASLGTDVLFRGQCEHYTLPDGSVSLMPSQLRKGCIPPLMLKWSYYATEPNKPEIEQRWRWFLPQDLPTVRQCIASGRSPLI